MQSLSFCETLEERFCEACEFLYGGKLIFVFVKAARLLTEFILILSSMLLQKGLAVIAISSNSVATFPQVPLTT